MKKLILYTDGGSRGNPGHAASGFVIYDENNKELHAEGKYLGINTNNFAEYTALIEGLKKAMEMGGTEIQIRMDSELIVKQMKGQYKIKQPHLQLLASEVLKLLGKFHSHSFTHVRRELNKRADHMVNDALDKEMGK